MAMLNIHSNYCRAYVVDAQSKKCLYLRTILQDVFLLLTNSSSEVSACGTSYLNSFFICLMLEWDNIKL